MIRKDIYGDWWYNDDDGEHDAINLTELFGKGNEPKTDAEVIKLINKSKKWQLMCHNLSDIIKRRVTD